MTTLSGIRDASYLVMFLGKKIAVKTDDPKRYYLYPYLKAIYAQGYGIVVDKDGKEETFRFEHFENPYMLLQEDIEVVIK